MIVTAVIAIACKLLLDWYLNTKSGYLLRAAGDNDALVTALAKDKGTVKIIGLAIANGLAALSGGILCQKQGFLKSPSAREPWCLALQASSSAHSFSKASGN